MKPFLNLTIKRQWYVEIATGRKREEYRWNEQAFRAYREGCRPGSVAIFRVGYRMDSSALAVEVVNVTVRNESDEPRHRDWGEYKAPRVVLHLGAVLKQGDYATVKRWVETQP